jgi:hypothetical protein
VSATLYSSTKSEHLDFGAKMAIQTPSNDEIRLAVTGVFDQVRLCHADKLLNALVVVDKGMFQGNNVINYVVDYEMKELCDFVNSFNTYLKQTDNHFQKARIRVLLYCHIMEADLPLTVIWNLLRILEGENCVWTIYRITKKGKKEICQYPREKITELSSLSKKLDMQIGTVLDSLLQVDLRNAFSHSQYCLKGEMLTATGSLSPLSRKNGGKRSNPSFTFDDIERLYEGSSKLLRYFTGAYRRTINPFKDGNAHPVDSGLIVWDSQAGWHWKGNA